MTTKNPRQPDPSDPPDTEVQAEFLDAVGPYPCLTNREREQCADHLRRKTLEALIDMDARRLAEAHYAEIVAGEADDDEMQPVGPPPGQPVDPTTLQPPSEPPQQ